MATSSSLPSLCICDGATFWPWLTWTEIAALPSRETMLAVVPIAGMADHGDGLPLDVEEQILMRLVRGASVAREAGVRVLVVPPLRFVTGAAGTAAFAVEPPLAHAFIDEVCVSLAMAGFRKIVLCNASADNKSLCDAAARDIRIARGLQMFCVNLGALGVDFGPENAGRFKDALERDTEWLSAAAWRLAALWAEIAKRSPLPNGGKLEVKP